MTGLFLKNCYYGIQNFRSISGSYYKQMTGCVNSLSVVKTHALECLLLVYSKYAYEMVSLISNLFNNALETNSDLYFAVITGCLRISKESIFTGLNNLNVMAITDEYFNDSFGFTDDGVKGLLSYYDREEAVDMMREWYDGYQFGGNHFIVHGM